MATGISTGSAIYADSYTCGQEAASMALNKLPTTGPIQLAILFASTKYKYDEVLRGVHDVIGSVPLIGCSSAGEFSDSVVSDESTVIMLIKSDHIKFSTGVGKDLRNNPLGAVSQIFSQFRQSRGNSIQNYSHRSVLMLTDGLAGKGEALVDLMALEAGLSTSIAGGAAGDGGAFKETFLFHEKKVHRDSVVATEILSDIPLGFGVCHGWCPSKFSKKVTKSNGSLLMELDGKPAFQIYREYAQAIKFDLTPENSNMFMMANELGIHLPNREVKVRAPLKLNSDGSILMATEIPELATVSIVEGTCEALLDAAKIATQNAMDNLKGGKAAGVIVFDCIARKICLKEDFKREVEIIKKIAGDVPIIGFNTYGEIARVRGQLSGFHNTTDVVCIIPA